MHTAPHRAPQCTLPPTHTLPPTEPPIDVLNKIRERKEAAEKKGKIKEKKVVTEETSHQAKIREQATQRQIEALKAKLKPKSEL